MNKNDMLKAYEKFKNEPEQLKQLKKLINDYVDVKQQDTKKEIQTATDISKLIDQKSNKYKEHEKKIEGTYFPPINKIKKIEIQNTNTRKKQYMRFKIKPPQRWNCTYSIKRVSLPDNNGECNYEIDLSTVSDEMIRKTSSDIYHLDIDVFMKYNNTITVSYKNEDNDILLGNITNVKLNLI